MAMVGHDGGRQADQPDDGRRDDTGAQTERQAGEREGDDGEDDQAHRGSSGWASERWVAR